MNDGCNRSSTPGRPGGSPEAAAGGLGAPAPEAECRGTPRSIANEERRSEGSCGAEGDPAAGRALNDPGTRRPIRLGDPARVIRETFGCAPGDVAEDVVLTPFLPLKSFQRHVDPGTLRELAPAFFYRGFTALFRSRPVTVLLTGVGPSRVGDCVSLLSLTPARRILFVGAVGGLGNDGSIGDYFLPREAADGEGYSRYRRQSFAEIVREAPTARCDGGLEEELAAFLRARGAVVREGRVFTIGSIAVETRENLEFLAQRGFDALEMELSAFYAAAGHHGFAVAALTYVSDLPLRSSLWQARLPAEEEALRAAWRAIPLHAFEFLAAAGVPSGDDRPCA